MLQRSCALIWNIAIDPERQRHFVEGERYLQNSLPEKMLLLLLLLLWFLFLSYVVVDCCRFRAAVPFCGGGEKLAKCKTKEKVVVVVRTPVFYFVVVVCK